MRNVRIMFIAFMLMSLFCSNTSLKKERDFYDMAFDTLYNIYSNPPSMENISDGDDIIKKFALSAETRGTVKNLTHLAKQKAKNKLELKRFMSAMWFADSILTDALNKTVGLCAPYLDSLRKLGELRGSILITNAIIRSNRSETLKEENKKSVDQSMEALDKMEKPLEDLITKELEKSIYLKEEKQLRENGWLEYLEWKKFDE